MRVSLAKLYGLRYGFYDCARSGDGHSFIALRRVTGVRGLGCVRILELRDNLNRPAAGPRLDGVVSCLTLGRPRVGLGFFAGNLGLGHSNLVSTVMNRMR